MPSLRTASAPPRSSAARNRSSIHVGAAAPIAPRRPKVESEVTGRMPGSTGLWTPRSSRSETRPSYSSTSKKNCVTPKSASSELGGQVIPVALEVGRAGMARRVRGHADREAADGLGQFDQLGGIGQLPGAGGRILGWIAARAPSGSRCPPCAARPGCRPAPGGCGPRR